MNTSFREQLMEEKLKEEKEYYESIKEEVLNEIDELK
jgi:hypothetical protein